MKIVSVVFLILAALPLCAADDTQNLLEARRVNDYLQFQVRKSGSDVIVEYRSDPLHGGFKTLRDGTTFASPGEIDLGYHRFNPFKVSITSKGTLSEDPNAKAIADFVNALATTSRGVVPALSEGGGTGEDAAGVAEDAAGKTDCKKDFDQCQFHAVKAATAAHEEELKRNPCNKGNKAKQEECRTARAITLDNLEKAAFNAKIEECESLRARCIDCQDFIKRIEQYNERLLAVNEDIKGLPDEFRIWVEGAEGLAGVIEQKKNIDAKIKTLAGEIDNLAVSKAEGPILLATEASCDNKELNEKAAALRKSLAKNTGTVNDVIANALKLLDALKGLSKMLGTYANANWRPSGNGMETTDLIFDKSESTAAQMNTVQSKFVITQYTIDPAAGTITATNVADATRTFVVRHYRRFVPEVGVAAIYNEIDYPKYSADKVDGGFVIRETEADTNVNAAMTLNLLTNPVGGQFLYPGFQLGVSKVEDYPGILGGVVLRFAQPQKISIALGGILTWYKELKGLEPGATVPTEEEFEKALQRRTKSGWYFGVQYTF